MNEEFSYLEKDGQFFPVIEIELKNHSQSLKVKALIDSGASFSVFRPEIAEALGIKIDKGKAVYLSGIGGRILGYLHIVEVTLGKEVFPCKIVFSPEFTVSFNLLGRNNFFVPFQISFLEKKKKILIQGEANI